VTQNRRSVQIAPAVLVVLAVAAAATAILLHVQHAREYFYLFDDFALVGQTRAYGLAQLVSLPIFGFYRPLVFASAHLQAHFFGWAHPAGYAFVSLFIHAANAWLCAALARNLGLGRSGGAAAFTLALLSPWAVEAYYWLSGQFDLYSALGVLLSVNAAVWSVRCERGASRWAALALVVLGAIVAVASKENGVILPGCTLMLGVAALPRVSATHARRVSAALGLQAAAVVIYFFSRTTVLSTLGGAYGDFATLLRDANLLTNVFSYVKTLTLIPFSSRDVIQDILVVALARIPTLLVCLPACVIALMHASVRRRAAGVFGSLLLSIAPVMWFGVLPSDTSRFVYLPGLFYCLLLAAGWSRIYSTRDGRTYRQVATVVAVAVILASCVVSRAYQQKSWVAAARLSEHSIQRMGDALQMAPPEPRFRFVLTGVPARMAHGPYVTRDYAFQYYFGLEGDRIVGVSATLLSVDGRCATAFAPAVFASRSGPTDAAPLVRVGPDVGETICFD
jgi:hypothetical protein